MKMPEIKTGCNWYSDEPRPRCTLLTELVCKKKESCSFCESEASFQKRQRDFVEKHKDLVQVKKCSGCHKTKPLTEFCMKTSTGDGLNTRCRDCEKERAKEYFLRNRRR